MDEDGSIKESMIVEIPDFLTVNPIVECWNRLRHGAKESIEWNSKAMLKVRQRLGQERLKRKHRTRNWPLTDMAAALNGMSAT